MQTKITKRGKIRLYAFGVAAFSVLLVFALVGNIQAAALRRQVRISGERALCELDIYLDSMQTDLGKGMYASTSPMLGSLAENLHRAATGAKTSLSVLPLSGVHMDNTYKFLSQVGAFVTTLNRKLQAEEPITEEERAQMQQLLSLCETLADEISVMRTQLFDGFLDFSAADSTLAESAQQIEVLSADMEDAEQSLTEYPTLIYDGPFSDHIYKAESALLQDLPEISRDTAQKQAAKIFGVNEDVPEFLYEEDSATPAYCFRCGEKSLSLTKRGGILLFMLSGEFVGERMLSPDDARKIAQTFLTDNGFSDMQESYYTVADGICTINFAFRDGDYICYPDLIKISVSLADGQVLAADCRGYVMHHKTRSYPAPQLTAAEAQTRLHSSLTVLDTRLAVIPTESGGEQFAYELHCKDTSGTECLVYIDTVTGQEDDILLLLYADDSILTK